MKLLTLQSRSSNRSATFARLSAFSLSFAENVLPDRFLRSNDLDKIQADKPDTYYFDLLKQKTRSIVET